MVNGGELRVRPNLQMLVKDCLSPDQIKKWYWDKKVSVPEISKTTKISRDHLYDLMRKHQIPRRNWTESNYLVAKTKPQFCVKTALTSAEEKLKIAGIMLYWAEGAQNGGAVDFSNSKPEMIQIFLKFLREICGVAEARLRIYLYHHGDADAVKLSIGFWSELTKIPVEQFSRPYIRKGNPHWSGRIMPHGLVHIRYSDKRLRELIQSWIVEYSELSNGAGTQAANEARL